MSVAGHLCAVALRQVAGGAMQAVGLGSPADSVVKFLSDRFTCHSQKLTRALQTANERAWRSLEVALGGESFWERCKLALARADDQAFRDQVRSFLDTSPLRSVPADKQHILRKALAELRTARNRGLLSAATMSPNELARRAGAFAQFNDSEAIIDAEWKAIDQVAFDLREGCPNLCLILKSRSTVKSKPSLLAMAVHYHFRRLVETDHELFQGLAFAKLEALQEKHEKAFDGLNAALTQHGQRVEGLLGEVLGILNTLTDQSEDTNQRVRHLEEQIQRLLTQLQMQNREVRPRDSLSVSSDADQKRVQHLVAEYRELPTETRQQHPELLNDVGKLEVAAGQFEAAQRDFEEAASLAVDPKTQAEAHHNAYRAALERQQWQEALTALLNAAELDPARFAPFPLAKYEPKRILGAGGFGVVFLCQHKKMNKPVVVKTLLAVELQRDISEVFAEATALQDMDHPGVVRVKDCDYADDAGTRPYLVMDYFDGKNLADYVAEHGRLTAEELLAIARPIAEALSAAHERGILHRDVKPANILVRRDAAGWKAKLIDFGLALRPADLSARTSTSGPKARTTMGRSIAGTLRYAAPEQLGDDTAAVVGTYSDVYGFGRTCYYALLKTPEPDDHEKDELPAGWKQMLSACTRRQAVNRLQTFEAVLAELAKQVPLISPPDGKGATTSSGEDDMDFEDVLLPPDDETIEGEGSPGGDIPPVSLVENAPEATQVPGVAPADPVAAGIACAERGDHAQAIKAFTQALRTNSTNVDLYRRRARCYLARDNRDKAIEDLDKLIQLEPASAANRLERGRFHADAGSHDKAIADFNQAILKGATNEAYLARACSYAAKKVWDLAFPDFQQALHLAPDDAETYFHRGEARLGQGNLDEALADFNHALQRRPDTGRFINARGRIFLIQGKQNEALAEFILAAQRDPGYVETYLNRARIWLDRGQNEQAANDLTRALELDARCTEAFAARAQARAGLGQLKRALSDYNKALKVRPRDASLFVGRGRVQLDRGKVDVAMEDFRQAVKLDRNSVPALLGRADAHMASEVYGSAVIDYASVLKLQPGNQEALSGRAQACLLKRRYDEAIADASELIRLEPTDASAYHTRGISHREKKAFEQAIADLTECLRLQPANATAYDDRGLTHYQAGLYDQAIADFTSALKLDGKNWELYLRRARAYEKKREWSKGREDRARATALNPNQPDDAES